MKRLLLLAVCVAFTFLKSPAIYGIDFDRKELEKEIMNRLVLKQSTHQNRNFFYIEILKEIKSAKEISDLGNQFIEDNYLYINYLSKYLNPSFLKNRDQSIEDPDSVKNKFNEYLIENKKILNPIFELFSLFLKSKGHGLTGFVGEPKKKEFTFDQMKAIAVRNILPYKMTKKGRPGIKICVAGEGYKDFPDRNKHLEAFSFESVINGLKQGKLDKKIEESMNVVGKLKFSTDNDTAIKRAQGAFWWFFFHDKDFEKLLLDSYNNKKDYLPFVITIN
jgi:hypothetical protein